MHWWDGGWQMMGWMGGWWLIGAALIAVLVWALLRTAGGSRAATREGPEPEEIVKRRYARGEIDRETFQRMVTDLTARPPSEPRPPPGGARDEARP